MKSFIPNLPPLVLTLLVLVSFVPSAGAQEVTIPDLNLNAVVREALVPLPVRFTSCKIVRWK